MVEHELQHIIFQGENETSEFKSSFNAETIESLVAFANTKGGSVYVGITDTGKVVGVRANNESVQNWINEIKTKTEPSIIPDFEILEFENHQVVVFKINEYPVKPLSVKGRYFKRVANSNHLMSASEVEDCYNRVMQYSWDSYIFPGTCLQDLDNIRIDAFFKSVSDKKRLHLSHDNIENLQKLKFIKDGCPTAAAMLLFSREPLMYDVHAGRLKTPDTILDDKIIRNTLFETVEETMQYIISHLKVAYEIDADKINTSTRHTEIYEYPLDALREIVINAVIHRRYDNPVDIQIKIFDNKITIFNPGTLYGDLTIEDLKGDSYQSSARNKLIVEAFYLTGDIEKYGTGYRRIREAISHYPSMLFEYSEIQGGYLATLQYDTQKTTQKTTLNQRILDVIEGNNMITRNEIATELDISPNTVKEYLNNLKKLGLLQRIGPDKGGYWQLM